MDESIAEFNLYGQPLNHHVTSSEIVGDVVNLSLKIHKDADQKQLENVYHALRTRLHTIGVEEVNLNVVLSDTAPASRDGAAQTYIPTESKEAEPAPSSVHPPKATSRRIHAFVTSSLWHQAKAVWVSPPRR